ncbi:DinB family protein [Kaistia dalseonensis]|uniref:Damage-inducible protein DinB n=1 Tax=Kaistia dalseonensis TaxID=410840 RepID=A0ABU0H0D5_9HYPH|nr:DinB family protein [Kaistia dalseonensis]MCX5493218.1 DinB family protein [Kaistia dalseonensis]MDQ0435773.1 putative damage-inducible protein DinB [Kaistia dalseonensis]
MKAHFAMFAAYNKWANARLYAAAAAVSRDDYLADHGAFFHSLNGTLNHLVVTDRIWLRRMTGDGPVQTRLDEILTDDIATLTELRQAEDDRMIAFIDRLGEAELAGNFTYQPISNPVDVTQPLGSALLHVFNHQTHHRGQATAILTRVGGRDACESLDLIVFQRATRMGLG